MKPYSRIFLYICTLAILSLTGCGSNSPIGNTQEPTINTPTIGSTDNNPTDVKPGEQPGQSELTVDTLNLLVMESFPVQVSASFTGWLPDGCTEITGVTTTREENTFTINISIKKKESACTKATEPFEFSIPLEVNGLKAGVYTVNVLNKTAEFKLTVDNILSEDAPEGDTQSSDPNEDTSDLEISESAYINKITAELSTSKPDKVIVEIQGSYPDGCTTLNEINHNIEDNNIITMYLYTKRHTNMMCTMALEPFIETYEIDITGLSAGTYTIVLYDKNTTFTLK